MTNNELEQVSTEQERENRLKTLELIKQWLDELEKNNERSKGA